MEDEGFVDDDFIADTARDFIGRFGSSALAVLAERAEIAAASGHYLMAQTWREILEAAQHIVASEL